MQKTTTYGEQSRIYLSQAYDELAKGDLGQASEKGWGAAALMVKAVAQQRGWEHRGHRHLHGIIGTLFDETGDSELASLFGIAGDLHINFYENRSEANIVGNHVRQVERFVEKMEALLNGATQA